MGIEGWSADQLLDSQIEGVVGFGQSPGFDEEGAEVSCSCAEHIEALQVGHLAGAAQRNAAAR